VGKNIYNLLNKLTAESKPDMVPILREMAGVVVDLGGDDALSSLKQEVKNMLE